MKYQTGINDAVLAAIRVAKSTGLPYITKKDIVKYVTELMPQLDNVDTKVGQALFHLQKPTKYRRAKIRKFYNKNKAIGWTTCSEDTIYLLDKLPQQINYIKKEIRNLSLGKHIDPIVKENFIILDDNELLNDDFCMMWTKYLDKRMPWER